MSHSADEFLRKNPALRETDETSRDLIRLVSALTAPLARYFRFHLDGLDRVPDGPCLVVANHNVGAIAEILLLLREWHRHFAERPARGLLHQVAWQPPLAWIPLLQRLGGVFAHPEVARRTLERGYPLLVFPGGDVEACRPFSERNRVTLGERTGYVRLARETGVPIVPIVICGAHATYLALPGGTAVARWRLGRFFGLKSFPVTAGVTLAALTALAALVTPLGWPVVALTAAAAVIPLPSRIEAEVLAPIAVRAEETDAEVGERVRAAMQAAMDRLAARRFSPWG